LEDYSLFLSKVIKMIYGYNCHKNICVISIKMILIDYKYMIHNILKQRMLYLNKISKLAIKMNTYTYHLLLKIRYN